jgi:hypothetical protein
MCLLPRATLHSDSEQLQLYISELVTNLQLPTFTDSCARKEPEREEALGVLILSSFSSSLKQNT